jgi:hypothetical protein
MVQYIYNKSPFIIHTNGYVYFSDESVVERNCE